MFVWFPPRKTRCMEEAQFVRGAHWARLLKDQKVWIPSFVHCRPLQLDYKAVNITYLCTHAPVGITVSRLTNGQSFDARAVFRPFPTGYQCSEEAAQLTSFLSVSHMLSMVDIRNTSQCRFCRVTKYLDNSGTLPSFGPRICQRALRKGYQRSASTEVDGNMHPV